MKLNENGDGHTLSLVIPAEEAAIQSTLERAVRAVERFREEAKFGACEVILVDDGSTDKTLEIARKVAGIRIVTYPRNRGYGAAIETGFAAARGNYLAFMDADGTCDPDFLLELWKEMGTNGADVVLGCRLHGRSKMPLVRRLGNIFYAWLLFCISKVRLQDTASGMRLLKRSALSLLSPLPEGLSYTPAMSAKCVMDPRLTIREVDMPYEDRVGESKLNVLRDGIRFLQVILITGVFYSPVRIFGGLGLIIGGWGLIWVILAPMLGYTSLEHVFMPGYISLFLGALCMTVGLTFHLFSKQILPGWPTGKVERWISKTFSASLLLWTAFFYLVAAVAMFLSGISGGTCSIHLALLLGGFLLHVAVLCVFVAVGRIIIAEIDKWRETDHSKEGLLAGVEIIEA